jgi:hypothetical protein
MDYNWTPSGIFNSKSNTQLDLFGPYMLDKNFKSYMHVYSLRAMINCYNIKGNDNTSKLIN